MPHSGWKYMTVKEFAQIKKMFELKLSVTQIMELTGRTHAVVSRIQKSDTFNQYKDELQREYENRNKAKEVTPAIASVTPSTSAIDYDNTVKVISQQLDHLEKQMQEVIDNQNGLLATVKTRKIIW